MKQQIIIYLVLGLIAYLLITKGIGSIGRLIGFNNSQEDKEENQAIKQMTLSDAFKPTFWKEFPAIYLMPMSRAQTLARQVEQSWGYFNDDEAQIVDALRQASSQVQISQIAGAYSQLFKEDLLSTLKGGLSDSEMKQIWDILKVKRKY